MTLVKHHTALEILSTPFHNLIQPSLALCTARQTRVRAKQHTVPQGDFLLVHREGLVALNLYSADVAQVAAGVEVQVGVGREPDVPVPLVQPVLVNDACYYNSNGDDA